MIPERLPSLIYLVGFWIPPAAIGFVAAQILQRSINLARNSLIYVLMGMMVVGYAALWFWFNVNRMPPYVPGAMIDPTVATPEAFRWLAIFAGVVILPGSALACLLAFKLHRRIFRPKSTSTAKLAPGQIR